MHEPKAWRLIETPPATGAFNMAVDELLMESVRSGGAPTLRVYRWSPPCLSLGRNQPARGRYDLDALEDLGIDVVRRPTGGRAVLHADELTYAVVAPARAFGSARAAYRRVNAVLVSALGRLGAAAAVNAEPSPGAGSLSEAPCFADPAEGEVVALGRKLIGSAQLTSGGVLLQHGSLPLRRRSTASLPTTGTGAPIDGNPAYLEEVMGLEVSWEDVAAAVVDAWTEEVGSLDVHPLTDDELERLARIRAHYEDAAWTWRR